MKRLLLLPIVFAVLTSCQQPQQTTSDPQILTQLNHLVETQDYFRLRTALDEQEHRLSNNHTRYYRAMLACVFNDPEQSNQQIATLLDHPDATLGDTLMKELYGIKLQNHIQLDEYGKADQTNTFIQEHYRSLLDSSERDDLQNTQKIWHALRDIPKQEVVRNRDFTIPMHKDKVGLSNIEVAFDTTTVNMVFDTGANFSVVRRSYVDKLGLKLIPAGFQVGALTGAQITSDLAVADSLDIGGLTYKNVVFLVFNDADLTIPQVDYHINGIIGFPVIEAMDEIHIDKDDQLFIPQETEPYSYNNLALDGLMPVVAVAYRGDTLNFHLDTGAPSTSLFASFFRKYRDDIEANHEKTVFKSGGAGGVVEFEGYILDHLRLKIGDTTARLDSIQVHIQDIGDEENHFHGNLGQDYIRQFEEMIISFKYASLIFN